MSWPRDTLRRWGSHPAVEEHVSRALRARLTTNPASFLAHDMRGAHGNYVVRATRQRVFLEHGTPDVSTFDQTYYRHDHEPPPGAAAVLAGHAGLSVVDVGANIGMWSLWTAHRFRVRSLTAIEPVPRNVTALTANLGANLPDGTWAAVAAAASTVDGELSFGGEDTTRGHIGGTGLTVPSVDLFGLLDGVDLLKLDVEGAEWSLISDPRWDELVVPVVMLEHHAQGAPPGPALAAEEALRRRGYTVERSGADVDGAGVLWGVRA